MWTLVMETTWVFQSLELGFPVVLSVAGGGQPFAGAALCVLSQPSYLILSVIPRRLLNFLEVGDLHFL